MKTVAILILLGVFLRHDTAFTVAKWSGWTPGGIFYVQGALLEILLLALLYFFITYYKPPVPLAHARNVARFHLWFERWRTLGKAATIIGMVEAGMLTACQMAIDSRPPPGVTQCDHVTGLPIGAVITTLEITVLAWILGSWLRNGRDP